MALFRINELAGIEPSAPQKKSNDKCIKVGSKWEIDFDNRLVTSKKLAEWGFLWYGEAGTEPDFKRAAQLMSSGYLNELWGLRGILIAINQKNELIYIFNDGYGAFPIYFTSSNEPQGLLVSNAQCDFSSKNNIDYASFYQYLSYGYIFGAYSLFNNVKRLSANHCLKLNNINNKTSLSIEPLKNFWIDSHTASTDELIDILKDEAKGFENTQIMMSAGWDSRLLLSVLLDSKPTLYTHGNLQSREAEIVREIASLCSMTLVERNFEPSHFNRNLFSGYLKKNESAMFTHWAQAGAVAAENRQIITAGIFGEVLGGHFGAINTLPKNIKYLSLLMHMTGLGSFFDKFIDLENKERVVNFLRMTDYNVFWILSEKYSHALSSKDLINESNSRLKELFSSYETQGMSDCQSMFERFHTEYKGSQYVNLQLANAATDHQFRNIFTNKDLIQATASIPFHERAHNKINKRIIKKLQPSLLKFPMAATLVNASRPLLIQEGSRAFRKLLEQSPKADHFFKSHSKYGDRSFGWNDFEYIMTSKFLDEISTMLSNDTWNKHAIKNEIHKANKNNYYPLFDMISKASTLDYIVNFSDSDISP